ncbi:hypothetical protein [Stenotrophomonas pavanii]|uniref:hypothetical protein n=1 Tax=Stenotrophomonas pavanii TaxID=487698 RepID=UPI002E7A01DB|nr:hypothetical protein [Stenotrophomonas pavanii]
METTRQWLQAKLDTPGSFNTQAIAHQLQALQQGRRPHLFRDRRGDLRRPSADHPDPGLTPLLCHTGLQSVAATLRPSSYYGQPCTRSAAAAARRGRMP